MHPPLANRAARLGALALLAAAPAHAQSISAAEYFLNTDPGPGLGTPIEVAAPADFVSLEVALPPAVIAALPDGTHRLAARLRDSEGRWSEALTRTFQKTSSGFAIPTPQLTAAEYYIDTDPGVGLGTPVVLPAPGVTAALEIAIPAPTLAALPDGTHFLAARVRDSNQRWSVAYTRSFQKITQLSDGADPRIARVTYQWFQNGAPASAPQDLTPPTPAANVSFQSLAALAGLTEGDTYQLVFTPYDDTGAPGPSASAEVEIATTDSFGDGLPDQWKLTHGFALDAPVAALDSDDDGLTNDQEFLLGTDPRAADSSGDGISDGLAVQLTALGFDPLVNNPALVEALGIFTEESGLLTPEQLQALALGRPVLSRDAATGLFTLRIQLEKSTDLEEFAPLPFAPAGTVINAEGEIEFTFASPENAVFFRLQARD